MNILTKAGLSMAAIAFASVALAGPRPHPTLVPANAFQKVSPQTIQKVIMVGGQVIPMGPVMKYHDPISRSFRKGLLIYDSFEGNSTNNDNPDVPTDGLYGETFIPGNPGARWYLGDSVSGSWINTYFARRYEQIFPGQAGKSATGFDFVMHNNSFKGDHTANTEQVKEILVFTSGDGFDPNSPVPPSNINAGVKITYAGINPGAFVYSNVDLTSVPLTMPTGTNGWYLMIIASGDDANGNPIEATSAQPMLWGTKAHNPSVASQYAYMDGPGDGTGRLGTLNQLYDWTFGYYGTATAYTVTRGVENGTHDISKLTGIPGSSVVVDQRLQNTISANNAEVTATVTLDPNTPPVANLILLRAVVRCKANPSPLNDPTCFLRIYMFNRSTNVWDVVETRKPTFPLTDGDLVVCPSIPIANIPNYINTVDSTVQVRIGVVHQRPNLINWKLYVNLLTVDASDVGPDPLCESCAFSAP